jgi:hypothetical protein
MKTIIENFTKNEFPKIVSSLSSGEDETTGERKYEVKYSGYFFDYGDKRHRNSDVINAISRKNAIQHAEKLRDLPVVKCHLWKG